MKLMNKFFIGSLCLGLLILGSCTKGDDEGPSEPAYQGTFMGSLTDITALGAVTDYVATSITAIHDTSGFSSEGIVKIEVTDASGVKIIVNLADTAAKLTPYDFRSSTSNSSTITLGTNNGPYSTDTDDISTITNSNGSITITDNGMDDGILRGTINSMLWYKIKPAGMDSLRAVMQNGSFEVPLTRIGYTFEPGDATISAKIDGTAFNATTTFSSGFTITATNASLQSLNLTLPEDATVGTHDLNQSSDYQIMFMSGTTGYNSLGTINITEFDANAGTASGTFQFTATPFAGGTTVSVTEGAFTF